MKKQTSDTEPGSVGAGSGYTVGKRKPDGNKSRRGFLNATAVGAASVAALGSDALWGSGARAEGNYGSDGSSKKSPLVLEDMGSFFVGGRIVTGPGQPNDGDFFSNVGEQFKLDALYAQYLIPLNAKKTPLVMVHGGGQTGKTYETTPDGREGFQTIFPKRGWSTYVVDFPRRGKAGVPTFNGSLGDLEGQQIVPSTSARVGDQTGFGLFRVGRWDQNGPRFFPDVQFARTQYALDQYAAQSVALFSDDTQIVGDSLVALLDRIGPSVLITHSQSGDFGWNAALNAPTKVKAIVSYEPGPPPFPVGQAPDGAPTIARSDFNKLLRIPIQIVFGDNITNTPSSDVLVDYWRVRKLQCKLWVDLVIRSGGSAEFLDLPAMGIHGNTHFAFSDLNNFKIADLLSDYLRRTKLDRLV